MRKQKAEVFEDFTIPIGAPTLPPAVVFASVKFQEGNTPINEADLVVTPTDLEWVNETLQEGMKKSPAPSLAAERYLKTHFSQYDFDMPANKRLMQNFVLTKYFQQANDPDPKIAKAALDSLAKTNVVGLMDQKIEVNVAQRTSEDLEGELTKMLMKFLGREEKVINGEAVRA